MLNQKKSKLNVSIPLRLVWGERVEKRFLHCYFVWAPACRFAHFLPTDTRKGSGSREENGFILTVHTGEGVKYLCCCRRPSETWCETFGSRTAIRRFGRRCWGTRPRSSSRASGLHLCKHLQHIRSISCVVALSYNQRFEKIAQRAAAPYSVTNVTQEKGRAKLNCILNIHWQKYGNFLKKALTLFLKMKYALYFLHSIEDFRNLAH